MSHISEFMEHEVTPMVRKQNITSAWDCYTTANKTGRLYKSVKKSYSRRVSYAADLIAGNEEEQNPEVLSSLCRTQWRVFRVSPLWNVAYRDQQNNEQDDFVEHLEYNEAAFKRYARVICGYVIANQVNIQDMPNKVEMTSVKGLRGSRNDRDAIKVTVHSVFGEESRLVFTGVLCAVEAAELKITSDKATVLPVFLAQGLADVTDRVIFGLEKCFDCVFGPMVLPGAELSWMSAMWAGLEVKSRPDHSTPDTPSPGPRPRGRPRKNKTENVAVKKSRKKETIDEHDVVKFSYVIPESMSEVREKIKHLTLALPAPQLKVLWSALHEESESEFTAMEMEAFHRSLGLHLKTLFSIDFTKLDLAQISLPFFQANQTGRIRIEAEEHVKVVLRYLTELCQGEMLSSDPTLSVTCTDNVTMEWA